MSSSPQVMERIVDQWRRNWIGSQDLLCLNLNTLVRRCIGLVRTESSLVQMEVILRLRNARLTRWLWCVSWRNWAVYVGVGSVHSAATLICHNLISSQLTFWTKSSHLWPQPREGSSSEGCCSWTMARNNSCYWRSNWNWTAVHRFDPTAGGCPINTSNQYFSLKNIGFVSNELVPSSAPVERAEP